jgi:hypothetical protein
LRKDVALRQAKLDYREQANPEFRDPYFWAGFIAIGDMSPISKSQASILLITIFSSVVLLMVVVGYFYHSKYRRNNMR